MKLFRKGPFEVPPISKENGCRFYDYKPHGVKVAVGKVIIMMNYPSISPKTIARIARGATSLEQKYYYNPHGHSNRYCIRVTYPNGYGALIIFDPGWDDDECWDVSLLWDDELCSDDDGCDCTWSDLTEEDMVGICDQIYFMQSS